MNPEGEPSWIIGGFDTETEKIGKKKKVRFWSKKIIECGGPNSIA